MAAFKTYDSVIAANYLRALAFKKGLVLNVTKVQKLLFIAYGYFLDKYDHVLVDEAPKAWPYGPVFPNTRNKLDYSRVTSLDDPSLQEIAMDATVTKVFQSILERYAKYTASQLSEWSHMEGTPWHYTKNLRGFSWNAPIPDEATKTYFSTVSVL